MLRELSVQNLALIEDARIELQPGYCAWTGETGAGKSLLLTAVGLVLGGKATPDLIRAGRTEARASAVFDVSDPGLSADVEAILGGPVDDGTLILTRRVASNGRGAAHANGVPVPVATLRALGSRLIDIHGQHETRTLLDPDGQRALLDAYGNTEGLLATFRDLRTRFLALRDRRAALLRDAQNRDRERALLQFELDELTAAEPRVGEAAELTQEVHRLASAGQIRAAAQEGYSTLYESDRSMQGMADKVARRLAGLASLVPEFADAAAELERIADETREIAYSLRRIAQSRDDDPGRIEEAEGRLATYRRLASRFRCDPDELPARLQTTADRLAHLDRDETDLLALDGPIAAAWADLRAAASALTAARTKASKALSRAVQVQLKALGMPEARITCPIVTDDWADEPSNSSIADHGADRVEFLFAANPGVEARPLRKTASGGELSRVMLAAKTALAGVDRTPTLIFDEIDTGVGGRLGSALGRSLAELARHHQVICVTHLPQMASFASHQWIIRKQTERGQTWTTIAPLDDNDRVAEIAAMLRGDSAAEGTRQEALSMLLEARGAL